VIDAKEAIIIICPNSAIRRSIQRQLQEDELNIIYLEDKNLPGAIGNEVDSLYAFTIKVI